MSQPEPDPGNSPPEKWAEDLDAETEVAVFGLINNVAVNLPEPEIEES